MQATRNDMISIAKGITIILMVMMHSSAPDHFCRWASEIRMPLFFFVSGYCFKLKYLSDFKTFGKRKVKGIYWPFVKWSVVLVLFHNVCVNLHIYDSSSPIYDLKDIVVRIGYIVLAMYHGPEHILGAYWFLKELFIGAFLFYAIMWLFKARQIAILVASLAICFGGYWLFSVVEVPVLTPKFLLAAVYMVCGYIMARHPNFEKITCKGWIVLLLLVVTLIGSNVMTQRPMSMSGHTVYTLPLFLTTSIIGCLLICGVSNVIKRNTACFRKVLVYIGDRTFKVLTWHFLAMAFVTFVVVHVTDRDTTDIVYIRRITDAAVSLWPLYTLAGVGLPLLVNHVYEAILRYIKEKRFLAVENDKKRG